MKPLNKLTCSDIMKMPEEDFAALLMVTGPVGEPVPGSTVYMPSSDWKRIAELFDDENEYRHAAKGFGLRVLIAKWGVERVKDYLERWGVAFHWEDI